MGNEAMIGDVPKSTFGMSIDLLAKVRDGAIAAASLERFLKGQNPFMTTEDILGEWHEMYWKIFKIDPGLDRVTMPETRPGFGWAVPRVPEISTNLLWEAYRERWNIYSYAGGDLETAVPTNDRHYSRGPYGIWVRDRREADEELKNLSAGDIVGKKLATMTLDERLALGLFFATRVSLGLHVDVEKVTLCAGSRDRDGNVPYVHWHAGRRELYVSSCRVRRAYPSLRAREVVS